MRYDHAVRCESRGTGDHTMSGSENSSGAAGSQASVGGNSESNRGAKYVVLGAGGFVGGAMVERLNGQGSRVVPVIHRIGPGSAFLARFGLQQRIADLGDPAALKRVFEGADAVFHCVTGDRAATVQGLTNSLTAAQATGIRRFVYLSSAVVHGFRPASPLVETSPIQPADGSDYAKNKADAEKVIANWRGSPETVVLRPSIIYGPRSKYWSEYPARQIVSGMAYLVDEGRGCMNDIHIDHLLDAMLLAAHHPKAANQIYVAGWLRAHLARLLRPSLRTAGRECELTREFFARRSAPQFLQTSSVRSVGDRRASCPGAPLCGTTR